MNWARWLCMKGYCQNCEEIIPVLRGPQRFCKACYELRRRGQIYGPTRRNRTRVMWEITAQENDGVRDIKNHAPLVELPGSGDGKDPPGRPLNGHHPYCDYGWIPHDTDYCRGFWNGS